MTPLSPELVPAPLVRRLRVVEGRPAPVQQVEVPLVPSPRVVPRKVDPVGLRLMALQLENDRLRAEMKQLRTA